MTTNTLNQGQQDAADGFFRFLLEDEVKELSITGPGGVGKTHLMGYMIDNILPRYLDTCKMMGIPSRYTEVEMTATTNKAADVLGQATNRPTGTIHSHLNLKIKEDYSNGRSILTKNNNWKVHEGKIVFIDEASMADTPLRNFVLEGHNRCKIVWVGDHCQLAPIMEPISPVYKSNIPTYELTQPMRTTDPHLQALNQQLRNTVQTGKFYPIQVVPGVIDWLSDAEFQAEIDREFAGVTEDRVLAYTNKRVLQVNDYIRDLRGLPPEVQQGEILVNNAAVRIKSIQLSVEEEITILDISDEVEQVMLMPNVYMDIRRATIHAPLKGTATDVPLPVDRKFQTDITKWFGQQRNWERYFHMKNTYPDLRERDASTVHKAQGSSHDTIYIDAADISECRQADQAARLLYVAGSRARHRVVFHGELAPKFGGLVR